MAATVIYYRTSVSLKHIRAVHVTQGFLNRILGVGTIQILTAGEQPEFTVDRHARPRHETRRIKGRNRTTNPERPRLSRSERGYAAPACGSDRAHRADGDRMSWNLLLRRICEFLGPVLGRARAQDCGAHRFRRLTRRDPRDDHRVWRRCHIRRTALHHRRVFDFPRDLLTDDRLDFLGEATAPGRGSGPVARRTARRRSAEPGPRPAADNICAWSRSAQVPAGAPRRP
jgi:hypothetical protein